MKNNNTNFRKLWDEVLPLPEDLGKESGVKKLYWQYLQKKLC